VKRETFLPEADAEFREAARYYESEAPGLGVAFVAEIRRAISEILTNPEAATLVGGGIRRRLVRRFPYSLLYSLEGDEVVVLAVAHQKRRPRYWKPRIEEGCAEPEKN
jgi:plasmid stabilization system protein ParE